MSNSFKTHTSGSSSVTGRAGGGNQNASRTYNQEMRIHCAFKNSLPFKEQPQRSLSAFKAQKSAIHSRQYN